jgi:plastocyanin
MALFGIGFAACGGEEEAASAEPEVAAHIEEVASSEPGGAAPVVVIVSKDRAFDKSEIRVPSGQKITILHYYQDDSSYHSLAIYKTSEAKDLIARTEVKPGPGQQELTVEALEPGEYIYRCDLHPTTATGVLIVEE